jgi:hypothetical protein
LLKPGKPFRCSLPDSELFWREYNNPKIDADTYCKLWGGSKYQKSKETIFIDVVCTTLLNKISEEQVKNIVKGENIEIEIGEIYKMLSLPITKQYQADNAGAHFSWWTADKMRKALIIAGFSNVSEKFNRNESNYPDIFVQRYIDRTQPQASFMLEAIK